LRGGDGAGELPEVVDVGVPPVSLLLLLSVVADEGRPTYKIRQISLYHTLIQTPKYLRRTAINKGDFSKFIYYLHVNP
jgi:hypothetical protein